MNATSLDGQILAAIRAGQGSRERLMAIDSLRVMTWKVVAERLNTLTKRGAIVFSKDGWRLNRN